MVRGGSGPGEQSRNSTVTEVSSQAWHLLLQSMCPTHSHSVGTGIGLGAEQDSQEHGSTNRTQPPETADHSLVEKLFCGDNLGVPRRTSLL